MVTNSGLKKGSNSPDISEIHLGIDLEVCDSI